MENRKVLPLSFIRCSKSSMLLGGCDGRFSQFLAMWNSQRQGVFGSRPPQRQEARTFWIFFVHSLQQTWMNAELVVVDSRASNFWQRLCTLIKCRGLWLLS